MDNTVLSDYLDGKEEARRFLRRYEDRRWTVSTVVVYEAFMGSLYGYIGGDVPTIESAITASMDVLPVTIETAREAGELQRELLDLGVPTHLPDGLIAANAREHGAAFVTGDEHFWKEGVREVLDVIEYEI
nr:PIN domain-containing protein [Halalkalicoccus sp. NIPERK01]